MTENNLLTKLNRAFKLSIIGPILNIEQTILKIFGAHCTGEKYIIPNK